MSVFTSAQAAQEFITAGNAIVTAKSLVTGRHFTYRVKAPSGGTPTSLRFVSVLTGANNERDYEYVGTLNEGGHFRHGTKSRISPDALSVKAFAWVWAALRAGTIPAEAEVRHEGRCGRCGRTLTTPESLESGIGPVCEGRE